MGQRLLSSGMSLPEVMGGPYAGRHRDNVAFVAKGGAAGSRQAIKRHIHHTRDQVVRLREATAEPRVHESAR